MKNLFTRRKFLQTAAVTTSAAMLPSIPGTGSDTGIRKRPFQKNYQNEGLEEPTGWFHA